MTERLPSRHPHPQLLRKLPAALPRGLALQQHGAALLLERLLPPPKSGHKSAISRRGGAELDPAAVIAGQWWFTKGKDLVVKATSGGQEVPRDGYAIGAGACGVPAPVPRAACFSAAALAGRGGRRP